MSFGSEMFSRYMLLLFHRQLPVDMRSALLSNERFAALCDVEPEDITVPAGNMLVSVDGSKASVFLPGS